MAAQKSCVQGPVEAILVLFGSVIGRAVRFVLTSSGLGIIQARALVAVLRGVIRHRQRQGASAASLPKLQQGAIHVRR